MKFNELATVLSEYTTVYLTDENEYLLAYYDGRNSIPPEYGEYEVLEVSVSNPLVPSNAIAVMVKEA